MGAVIVSPETEFHCRRQRGRRQTIRVRPQVTSSYSSPTTAPKAGQLTDWAKPHTDGL